jgi:hypothetical protein
MRHWQAVESNRRSAFREYTTVSVVAEVCKCSEPYLHQHVGAPDQVQTSMPIAASDLCIKQQSFLPHHTPFSSLRPLTEVRCSCDAKQDAGGFACNIGRYPGVQ